MTYEEIRNATYEELMARNVDLVEILKETTKKKGVPWHVLSVELAELAEERRMVMSRMSELSKKGITK